MNGLDIFFVVVLGFFLFRGVFRGLILEISSIVGLIAGFMVSNRYYMELQPVANRVISNPEWAQVAAYLGIFISVMFVVALFSVFLKKLLKLIMLGWLDRIGGGLLGLIKAGLICSLTLLVMTVFLPEEDELITTSKISPYVHTMSQNLARYLPEELKDKFMDKASNARSFWEDGWDELIGSKKENENNE